MDLRGLVQGLARDILGDQQMSEEDFEKIYRQIEDRVDNEPPPRFAFIGEAGVGKSSTLNALFNAGVAVSHIEACTRIADKIECLNGALIAYDMPGLGESRLKQREHIALYERVLKDVDVALWILDAQNRAIASVQEYLEAELQSINPRLLERMVIALNKVDLVYPGELAWHPLANLPSEEQEENIKGRIRDVKRRIREVIPNWKGKIIGYSANKRYNLPHLFDAMMDAVPNKRKWVVASRKALADFLELVDPQLLPPEKRRERATNPVPQPSKMSDVVSSMPPEEFAKFAGNQKAFIAWLKQQGQ
ncbi:GTPase family protein [Oscillatoria salina]|uniref:GTPase family protein n=1 Tax=Oscillatoria salina TaxID=331517 RepID=UPI0013B97602|nr:GTPase [Oscillatoria salina]MBZ8179978.1 GTP-binding protein HSR1 [Oscillatoria salina IIICB1]NET86797.1 GTP-binding protein HSR1 [Kamptonema sp. SIO1D9]